MADPNELLREQLVRALDWEEAHVGFDKAVNGVPLDKCGEPAPGFEHTIWRLVEHLRIAQNDILDFCRNAHYAHTLQWPRDYWPQSAAPEDASSWESSLAGFRDDREQLKALARDRSIDLHALVPTGKGRQTYLRELMLVIDHNAYHIGQVIQVRRALGIWP